MRIDKHRSKPNIKYQIPNTKGMSKSKLSDIYSKFVI